MNGSLALDNPNIVLEMAMAKANRTNGHAEVTVNGVKLTIDAPFPDRPKLLRITADDGRVKHLGDYNGITHIPERENWADYLSEDEKAELADAEGDLADAWQILEQRTLELQQAEKALQHFETSYDVQGDPAAALTARRFKQQIDAAEVKLTEARGGFNEEGDLFGFVQSAQAGLSTTQERLRRVALARMIQADGEIQVTQPKSWREKLREERLNSQ